MIRTLPVLALTLCVAAGMSSTAQAGLVFSQDFESGVLGAQESVGGNFSISGSNANFVVATNGTQAMGHPGTYGSLAYDFYQISGLAIDPNTTLEFDYVIAVEDAYDRFNLIAALTGNINPPFGLITPDSGMVYTNETVSSAAETKIGDIAARSQSGRAVFDLSAFAGSMIDIRFQFGSDAGVFDHGIIIDNIVINTAEVPEAGALGLFGLGLAGLGAAAARRRRER